MMGLDKPQLYAKYEVDNFIYYENITEFVLKIGIYQNGKTHFWRKTDFATTFMELWLQEMGDFFNENRILQWKILNFGRLGVGANIF